MDDRTATVRVSNASRKVAMVAVAVLVVIAIAGFVLATVRARGGAADPSVLAASTQSAEPPMTEASAIALAELRAGPDRVVFAPGSDALSEPATAKIQRFAENVPKDGRLMWVITKIENRGDQKEQMELARKRAYAVRGVLLGSGVPGAVLRVEVSIMPKGLLLPADVDRAELAVR